MPHEQITRLRQVVEDASEMSDAHRSQMLEVVSVMEKEIEGLPDDHDAKAPIRDALELAERVTGTPPDHNETKERLESFKDSIEKVAVSHPVIARFLGTLSRMI
jgi:hypothetical protein